MGILNLTPDSFFDGGRYASEKSILEQVEKMLEEGASIIDIGAYSTRPGAAEVSEEIEFERLFPVIHLIRKTFKSAVFSVDTFRSKIARLCIEAGVDIINDISGGTLDDEMFTTIAQSNVPYVLTHLQGSPQNMQKNPHYTNVVEEVSNFFHKKIKELTQRGINQLIIDPGFGFGKTNEHNFELLRSLQTFGGLGYPILAGLSRKSMIGRVLDIKNEDSLNGTTSLNTIALLNGATILRVHDVKEAVECIKLTQKYLLV